MKQYRDELIKRMTEMEEPVSPSAPLPVMEETLFSKGQSRPNVRYGFSPVSTRESVPLPVGIVSFYTVHLSPYLIV